MSEHRNEIQVGLFAVIGILLLAMLTLVFGGFKGFFSSAYEVTAGFPNAGGTTQGTPVRLLGIEIGRVRSIVLAPNKAGVLMTLEINNNVDIAADAPLSIRQEGFIANIYLEFGAGSTQAALPKDGSAQKDGKIETFAFYVEKAATTLTDMSGKIDDKVGAVATKLEALADNLNALTGDEKFRNDVKTLAANTSVVTGQLKERLPSLIDNLDATAKSAKASIDKASTLFDSYQALGEGLKETDKAFREQITKQGANLDKLTASLSTAADDTARLATSLDEIARALKGGQGTMGKLITDDDLYRTAVDLIDTLTTAADEFKDLAQTIKKHPDWILKGPPRGKNE